MKSRRFFFILIVFLLSTSIIFSTAFAQDQTCLGLIDGALVTARETCTETNRHEICYGHVLVNGQMQGGFDLVGFDSPGDMVSVSTLQSLKLSGFDARSGDWGVVQMRLQASIPNNQPDDVTVLIFGDVELQNSIPIPTSVEITISAVDYVPVYAAPSSSAKVLQLLTDTITVAVEQSIDSLWLRVELLNGSSGWVEAAQVTSTGDLSNLNIGEANAPYYHPMQAFYFQSGDDPSNCSSVPANGLLIQTPEGVGKVNLLINEVNIQLGSTAFIQAVPNKGMMISLLEGSATVEVLNMRAILIPGTQVFVPLDENLSPNAPPNNPQPYDNNLVKNLPVQLLERDIAISVPADTSEIATNFVLHPWPSNIVAEPSLPIQNSIIIGNGGGNGNNGGGNGNNGNNGGGNGNNGGSEGNNGNNGGGNGGDNGNNGGGNGNNGGGEGNNGNNGGGNGNNGGGEGNNGNNGGGNGNNGGGNGNND